MPEPTPPDDGKEMGIITVSDGINIACKRTGSGPPLVLVHGKAELDDDSRHLLEDYRATADTAGQDTFS